MIPQDRVASTRGADARIAGSGAANEVGTSAANARLKAATFRFARVFSGLAYPATAVAAARGPWTQQLRALLEGARPHQWAKNLLVFVPAMLSGTFAHMDQMGAVVLAFVSLCLIASGTYLLNDIRDLEDDRRHWSKCKRPLPAGRLSIGFAAVAAMTCIVLGLLLAAAVGFEVAMVAVCYLALTGGYSMAIKRIPIFDVSVLAALFTLRLALGIASAQVFTSPWLLVFSMFLFSSLCFAKRYVELVRAGQRGTAALSHRGYRSVDGPLLMVLGPSAGMGAVVTLILYIIFDAFRQTFSGNTVWLWAFPLILFLWVSRIWLMAARGELDDDPVAFAVRDAPSILLGTFMLCAFVLAWSGLFG